MNCYPSAPFPSASPLCTSSCSSWRVCHYVPF